MRILWNLRKNNEFAFFDFKYSSFHLLSPSSSFPNSIFFTKFKYIHNLRSVCTFGYTQARALVYKDHGADASSQLHLHRYSISPGIPSNHVLIRFLASPINPADINQIQGFYPSLPNWTSSLGTPYHVAVAGNEGVAEVMSVGPNDSAKPSKRNLSSGDWVVPRNPSFGTWRSHALVRESDLLTIPAEWRGKLSAIDVGCVSVNPCTAYRLLCDFWPSNLTSHDNVNQCEALPANPGRGYWLIQNAANSAVGRAVIQLAHLWGIHTINIIRERSSPQATQNLKKELVDLGADIVLTDTEADNSSYLNLNIAPKLAIDHPLHIHAVGQSSSYELASHRGENFHSKLLLGLNCVSGRNAMKPFATLLAPGSRVVTYGAMARKPLSVSASSLIFQDLKVCGFWLTRWSYLHPEERIKTIRVLLSLIQMGKLRVNFSTNACSNETGNTSSMTPVEWSDITQESILLKPIRETANPNDPGKRTKYIFTFKTE